MKETRNAARKRRHVRVRSKVIGLSAVPRLSVFRSLKHIYAQIIDDTVGRTLVSASSLDPEVRDQITGLNKTEQAKLVGKHLAEKALLNGVTQVVFDRAGYLYHGRVKALADASREAGLKF